MAVPTLRRDAALAILVALAMSAAWAWAARGALAAGVLPDTDDVLRLQQVRDWLGGQAFGDLTQHRLGMAGVAMHWSRLPDLIPAALIAVATPFVGRAGAELFALIAWPASLLALFVLAAVRLSRRLGGGAVEGAALALTAYPAITLFAPGRIDHHGLQIVCLLGLALALTGGPARRSGAAAGVLAIVGLAIGMETVPAMAAAIGALLVRWTVTHDEDARVAGLAAGLGGALALAVAALRTDGWSWPACDGFTATSATGAAIGVAAVGCVGLAGRLRPGWPRFALLGAVAAGTGALVTLAAPGCADPYGGIDPLLRRHWLSGVGEAQPFFRADPRWAVAYLGLPLAGLVAGVILERRAPDPARRLLLAVVTVSLVLAAAQLRAAGVGAAAAVPILAGAVAAARRRGALAVAAAWIASAGIVWPFAAAALPVADAPVPPACDGPVLRRTIARLPSARVLAPIDMGPWLIAAGHHALAGPYHRNAEGNRLALAFPLLTPEARAAWAARARIDLWVACTASGPALHRYPVTHARSVPAAKSTRSRLSPAPAHR